MRTERFLSREHLYRIRWDVFGSFSDIQVENCLADGKIELSPFDGHPIAMELATRTGLTLINVYIMDLEVKYANDEGDEEDRYKPPPRLRLEREDGGPITVGDFVVKIHEYCNEHKQEYLQEMEEMHGCRYDRAGNVTWRMTKDTQIFWWCAQDYADEDVGAEVALELWPAGNDGQTVEDFFRVRRSWDLT